MMFDLALTHGRIWTENPLQPEAEAIGIVRNRVAQVGSSSDILTQCDTKTRVVDLKGRRVVPGFNDAHVHFYLGGVSLSSVQLRDAGSPAEFRSRMAACARTRPKGEWILSGTWDAEMWSGRSLPDCSLIDDVTPDHPVFVVSVDGHSSLANSLAMRLAGIGPDVPGVPGGEIERRADGSLTGIFKDAAQALISRAIPPPNRNRLVEGIEAAQAHAAQFGVTSIQDMGLLGRDAIESSPDLLRAYQQLLNEDSLNIRVCLYTPLRAWKRLADLGVLAGFGNDRLRIGGIKVFSDGSLGSTTAWFFEPYTDAPFTCGIPSDDMCDGEQMLSDLTACDRTGLQLAIHAIGDRANHQILDFLQHIQRQSGKEPGGNLEKGVRDRRWRIEHAQHLIPSDFARFAETGVIASVQPYHVANDGRWADARIGGERAKHAFAFRSLIHAGATLALGSDWWVAPINPLLTIWAAVTRETLDGGHPGGWIPEQRISVEEAVHGYTVGSAYASGEEQSKGSLECGKLADLAILSDDIFAIPPADIRHVQVDATVFDGRVIFERPRSL